LPGLDEVTRFFEDHDVHQAIEKVMHEADIDYDTSTDYGLTFREFQAQYMDVLNKKTTLIIIGDGRSNYANPEAAILDDMREKCRRLIWLNPETEMFWYSGDSEMRTYEGLCNDVRPCANLNQLTEFIRELVCKNFHGGSPQPNMDFIETVFGMQPIKFEKFIRKLND
jgi:uncharacterized protein with von Willebrand factor type A (vWA) domain